MTEPSKKSGLIFNRVYTKPDVHPFDMVTWEKRKSSIKEADGSIVFEADDVEVPSSWSQLATDILASKYLRKAGVPGTGRETSAKQVISRIVYAIANFGYDNGYFHDAESETVFCDELMYLLMTQAGAFNSPVWFNTGLFESYGIAGNSAGTYHWDAEKNKPVLSETAYKNPSVSACFIQGIEDDLMSIAEHVKREMRVFKHGGGSGCNYSALRGEGEPLSGGGTSSGLMSFLDIFDAAAGATKSGGTCLAPNQLVYTAIGPVAVKDLADSGKDFVVLSYDPPAGRYKAKTARAWLAGHKKVVRIVTDKGEFETSFDHPFRTSSEDTVKAADLKPGTSLFACSVDMPKNYLRVHLRGGTKRKEFLHRLVAQDVMGVEINGYSIHHKNGDRLNNSPENLEPMLQSEHASEHMEELVASGKHVFQNEYFGKSGKDNPMHASSAFWADESRVNAYKAKQAEVLKSSGRAADMQRKSSAQRMLNYGYKLINAGCDISTFEKYWDSRKTVIGPIGNSKAIQLKTFAKHFGSYEGFLKALSDNNHRVVSVYDVGEMDVYDVEVDCPTADDKSAESGHNFVIWPDKSLTGSGVVVFNTRRAARMVVVDADHPDIEKFIEWKGREEDKAKALISGMGLKADFNGEAYKTVGGQNANNSVGVTDDFMEAVEKDGEWTLKWRTNGKPCKTLKARALWRKLAEAAHRCADPGLQFLTTINKWHTVPKAGPIRSPNPCCFEGSTLVETDEGAYLIGELADMAVSEMPKALCFDGNNFVYRKIKKAWKSGVTQTLVAVGVGDGDEFECTPEHRFMLESGEYVEAKNLKPGMELKGNPFTARVEYVNEIVADSPIPVFDLEVDELHNFVVVGSEVSETGIVVHNSEFLHHNDTACNLASLNLMRFVREDGNFDIQKFKHAIRIFIVAQDILVDYASYPTEAICQNSHDYRPLGLGYANLGTLLMTKGLPYDSDTGRQLAAAITSLMTGYAYSVSGEIANSKGAFNGFHANSLEMATVLRGHLTHSHAPWSFSEAIDVASESIQQWSHAISRAGGSKAPGLRNSQVTLLAPTGTIGLLMDCDTTGVEPEFALVKTKKLAGGGFLTIVNKSVERALRALGYDSDTRDRIIQHIEKTGAAEGAPGLFDNHLAVFDTAVGKRSIKPMGHVLMMAAVQPFLSGAISKTVNLPAETTVEQIEEIHMEAWKLGLKSIAIYRDGSKHSQVLETKKDEKLPGGDKTPIGQIPLGALKDELVKAVKDNPPPPKRKRLPKERVGKTYEARVGGAKVFVRTGQYADGTLGEIFVDVDGYGGTLQGLLQALAKAVSVGLQHGVPLEAYVKSLSNGSFDPRGPVSGQPGIKSATSLINYVMRLLEEKYLKKPEIAEPESPPFKPEAFVELKERDFERVNRNAGIDPSAPLCPKCGHLTVRNGACHKCENCGESLGCS